MNLNLGSHKLNSLETFTDSNFLTLTLKLDIFTTSLVATQIIIPYTFMHLYKCISQTVAFTTYGSLKLIWLNNFVIRSTYLLSLSELPISPLFDFLVLIILVSPTCTANTFLKFLIQSVFIYVDIRKYLKSLSCFCNISLLL